MKVKKYVARTMPEVMNQIRKELGSDAVILNSKEIKHGKFFGIFKKRSIEVIAALDPEPVKPGATQIKPPIQSAPVNNKTTEDVYLEIRQLQKMMEQRPHTAKGVFSPDYQRVYQHLIDQEVDPTLAEEIIETVVNQHKEEQIQKVPQIYQDTQREINNRLHELSFSGIDYTKKIIHFVGPTGVGKTTTIAKVAAECMLKDQKKVAFITADTYRIAAIEQLKTYARILDIPIEVVYNIQDYKAAVHTFKDVDVILVDTAGRNFRNEKYVQELKDNILFNSEIETFLVLSLTAKPADISDIYEQFRHIPVKELIFTKIDETTQYGSILNVALNNGIGIAYLTNGQDVPDDLIQPTPEIIGRFIVGDYGEI